MLNSTFKNVIVSFIGGEIRKITDIPQYTDKFYNKTHERESIHKFK